MGKTKILTKPMIVSTKLTPSSKSGMSTYPLSIVVFNKLEMYVDVSESMTFNKPYGGIYSFIVALNEVPFMVRFSFILVKAFALWYSKSRTSFILTSKDSVLLLRTLMLKAASGRASKPPFLTT